MNRTERTKLEELAARLVIMDEAIGELFTLPETKRDVENTDFPVGMGK